MTRQYAEIDDSILPVPTSEAGSQAGGEEKKLRKNVFIIFAHGQDLLDKIRKIAECTSSLYTHLPRPKKETDARMIRCTAMGATLFAIDSAAEKREEKLREVTSRLEDLHSVLYTTNQTRRSELLKLAESITAWWAIVRKEKVIFSTLNMWQWDQGRKTLMAEGWVPTRDIGNVQSALRRASVSLTSILSILLEEIAEIQTCWLTGKRWNLSLCRLAPTPYSCDSSYFPPHQQVYRRIPEHHRRLRNRFLPRSQPWIVHRHYIPLLVRSHVW